MKNLLVKLLPLLAIVIATPAFAGTHDEHHDRSNRHVSHGEYGHRHDREANRRERVIVVNRQYSSPRDNHHEVKREARRHHEYRGHHNSYSHR
jgi:uncharacterized protein YxeA